MQGELSEIDVRSILQLVELGQRTGELYVEAYFLPWNVLGRERAKSENPMAPSWFVFFLNGSITYAADSQSQSLQRLTDHLLHFGIQRELAQPENTSTLTNSVPEYGCLWTLLEDHTLTPHQGRIIIKRMIQETLFDLLSLHQGNFIFEISPSLAPQLTTFPIHSLVSRAMIKVQSWKKLSPIVQSPEQCPVIFHQDSVRESLPQEIWKGLLRWADGKTSLRRLARLMGQDIFTLGSMICPSVQEGCLQLVTASMHRFEDSNTLLPEIGSVSLERSPRVVCIDDGVALRKTVETILEKSGYEVTAIGNPLKALGLVFQLKPDLILCDIAMPLLDGYEVCAMLRKSAAFRQTPIIMLTGKEGFIDRVKARMVGATDYLTKPFGESELLLLIEKYIGLGEPNRENPNKLLAEEVKDELEINIQENIYYSSSMNMNL